MKVFIQGMRRSGTTILYDALAQDPAFGACWYEPFSIDSDSAPGGGSGARELDLAAGVRELRSQFAAAEGRGRPTVEFNYGAPRDAALELEPELPAWCVQYLLRMTRAAEHVLVKFVRMYAKLAQLRALEPDSLLLHVVRDPRAVAASQIVGRDAARAERFADAGAFFGRRAKQNGLWGSFPLSELLSARSAVPALGARPTDVERILLVWRHVFESTDRAGRASFGSSYLLVRHEDLAAAPHAALARIYALLGRAPPPGVLAWSAAHVRPTRPPLHAADPRWSAALAAAGALPALAAAGYSAVEEGPAP